MRSATRSPQPDHHAPTGRRRPTQSQELLWLGWADVHRNRRSDRRDRDRFVDRRVDHHPAQRCPDQRSFAFTRKISQRTKLDLFGKRLAFDATPRTFSPTRHVARHLSMTLGSWRLARLSRSSKSTQKPTAKNSSPAQVISSLRRRTGVQQKPTTKNSSPAQVTDHAESISFCFDQGFSNKPSGSLAFCIADIAQIADIADV